MESGPGALFGFNFCRRLVMLFTEIVISAIIGNCCISLLGLSADQALHYPARPGRTVWKLAECEWYLFRKSLFKTVCLLC